MKAQHQSNESGSGKLSLLGLLAKSKCRKRQARGGGGDVLALRATQTQNEAAAEGPSSLMARLSPRVGLSIAGLDRTSAANSLLLSLVFPSVK